jgi:hypothetical protein
MAAAIVIRIVCMITSRVRLQVRAADAASPIDDAAPTQLEPC